MKKPLLMTAFAFALAITAEQGFAAEASALPAPVTAAAPATGTQAVAATERKPVRNFFRGTVRVVGTGLQKTGEALGNAANKAGDGIDKLVDESRAKRAARAARKAAAPAN